MSKHRPLILAFALFFALSIGPIHAAESSASLTEVSARALKEGKDASLNAFFARTLGISNDQSPIPLRRLTLEGNGRTNVFNVSVADKRTIILSERKGNLSWFYLTDNSGKLKKAIINDAAVREGGLTNIALSQAQKDFEAQKSIWLNASSRLPSQPQALEEARIEIERLQWILYRGVRGNENEDEIRERLKHLLKENSEALAAAEASEPIPPGVVIPEDLKRMDSADPLADLAKAISTNDFRFIGLYGYTAVVPGATGAISSQNLRLIKGTSDYIENKYQARLQTRAFDYALQYNQALTRFLSTNQASTKKEGPNAR